MIRTLVGIPALLLGLAALTPQPALTDAAPAPAASPAAATPVAPGSTPNNVIIFRGPPETLSSGMLARPFLPPEEIRRERAEFEQVAHEQLAFRQAMLGALTPAHRELVGQIVGELAIAPNPDLDVATRRINAALSPGEAQNVLRIDQARESAMLRHMQLVAAEHGFPALPQLQQHIAPQAMSSAHSSMSVSASAPFGTDAASVVLRSAAMSLLTPKIEVMAPGAPP